jgi:hypothetical protein
MPGSPHAEKNPAPHNGIPSEAERIIRSEPDAVKKFRIRPRFSSAGFGDGSRIAGGYGVLKIGRKKNVSRRNA